KIEHFTLGPIDMQIEAGTITALVGDNGSGKSTLFKMIMNLVNPTEGSIQLLDIPVNGENEIWKKSIAYQPQTPIGYDAFTGNDLQHLISSWYPNWDQRKFTQLIQDLQIPLNKKFGTLSQGEQQKLSFALTLPTNTDILLLDEPTSFMDIPSKQILMDILIEWMEVGNRSILFASHQVEDIQKLADYIVLLQKGNCVASMEKDTLLASYRKYWLQEPVPFPHVPGEMTRNHNALISNQPEETEAFLQEKQITPISS